MTSELRTLSEGDGFACIATLDTQGEHVLVALPQGVLEQSEDGWGRALSKRELEILVLVARGTSNREIASNLGITKATLKPRFVSIYLKMGVGSGGEAAHIALDNESFTIPEIEAAIDDA